MQATSGGDEFDGALRAVYQRRMDGVRDRFAQDGDGVAAVVERTAAVDSLLQGLWHRELAREPRLAAGLAVVALGGYGRGQLFPFSDVDLLFCLEKSPGAHVTEALQRISRELWDSGLRASGSTRLLGECERFKSSDPEGSLALLDTRWVCGDPGLYRSLQARLYDKRSARDARALAGAAAELTRQRHARFGHTLFHLEPNVKDAPGGLRDTHVIAWLSALRGGNAEERTAEGFASATRFLTSVRVFLHLRRGRDDNTLDWHAQDEAARHGAGAGKPVTGAGPEQDPAYWMRLYFRQARIVARALDHELEVSGQQPKPMRSTLKAKAPARAGFTVSDGVLRLKQTRQDLDPAKEPEIVLEAFALVAASAVRLEAESEGRIAEAVPQLSAALEDGPRLWSRLRKILCGRYAADALRAMHTVGVLDLIVPEFHGIDALVIRDAYHRYTVDEHTFVLLEALHALADEPAPGAPAWRQRFGYLLRDLPQPELLYLAALLHDTGKARSVGEHANASALLADTVTGRLELDAFDRLLVRRLIECHLEMSAALRRDIFDAETVRVFADKVGDHDLLRMLTVFTYADISAVHPDALTPWKAENLWRLWMAAENQLDRSVDQDRVHTLERSPEGDVFGVGRLPQVPAEQRDMLHQFLEGIPERYLRTRSAETVRQHLRLASSETRDHVLLQETGIGYEVTFLTGDRPRLFADLTGALAGWGMNIVSAEAFSNAHWLVIDTFRFTDPYQTLALNPEEHERFRASLEAVLKGTASVDALLKGQRRQRTAKPRRVVETRVEFDNMSSAHSTLLQVIAQDQPGLLRKASLILSEAGISVRVALVDTEGEMAIDVFYVTAGDQKLTEVQQLDLQRQLIAGL